MIKTLIATLFLINAFTFSQIKPDSNLIKTNPTEVIKDTVLPDITDTTITDQTAIDTIDFEIPAGLTANDVIKKYVDAIGGADKIYNLVDRTTIMRGSIQGINVTIISYQKAPNKIKQEIKAGPNEQKIICNGEKGIMTMAGEEREITGGELEKLKYEATLTLLTDPEHHGVKLDLEGVEKVENQIAYKIIMTLPSGTKWTQYYAVDSGLKIKEEKYINSTMGLFQQEIVYEDYRETEGTLYPFKIKQSIGSQSMEFTVSSIKINTGLTDREFEIESLKD